MSEVLPIVAMVAGLAVVLGGVAWAARRIRRNRNASSAVSGAAAAYEQMYEPHAYDARLEVTLREQQPVQTYTSEMLDGRDPDEDRPSSER